ncbi:vWA domain-containing protein [Virgibacillus sediminis]|uniref:VWA domain-containing protein n=1 Tax=Virgibacillus sediminis TaxID=202260 RepID=A0ABV7A1J0_9BACI
MLNIKAFSMIIGLFMLIMATGCSSETTSGTSESDTKEGEKEVIEGQQKKEEKSKEEDGTAQTTSKSEPSEGLFEEVPQPPKTLEGLVKYPGGPFGGKEFEEQAGEIKEALDEFPSLQNNDKYAVEQYWAKLVTVFAEDYPDPANIVKKWEAFDFGNPEIEDTKYQFKENYNVEILLDSSGSMGFYNGSKSRMQLAKEAINNFAKELPKEANVGLRVYGFEGTGSNADKEISCASNELVYGLKPYNEKDLKQALDGFQPAGWTPLAGAIQSAKEDLKSYDGENNTNIIYIVSDGVETCDGDPVKVAQALAESNITPIVNVIGFDVDNEGQKQLEEIAEAAEGTYTYVKNQDELTTELERTQDMAKEWKKWKTDAISDVRVKGAERMNVLRDFRGEWADRRKREYHNFHESFEYLYDQGKISDEVKSEFYDLRDARLDMIYEFQKDIFDTHYELKEKESEEAKKYIDEEYKQNTDGTN